MTKPGKPSKFIPPRALCNQALEWMKKNPSGTFSMFSHYMSPKSVELSKNQVKDILEYLQNAIQMTTMSPESPKSPKPKNWTRILQKISQFHFPPAEAAQTEAAQTEA